jgi:hypothetical protein
MCQQHGLKQLNRGFRRILGYKFICGGNMEQISCLHAVQHTLTSLMTVNTILMIHREIIHTVITNMPWKIEIFIETDLILGFYTIHLYVHGLMLLVIDL